MNRRRSARAPLVLIVAIASLALSAASLGHALPGPAQAQVPDSQVGVAPTLPPGDDPCARGLPREVMGSSGTRAPELPDDCRERPGRGMIYQAGRGMMEEERVA